MRDNQTYVFGYRAVDANVNDGVAAVQCSDAFHRTVPTVDDTIVGGVGCQVPGMPTHTFTNPATGNTVLAQRFVPGVDGADPVTFFGGTPFETSAARHTFSTKDQPNEAYGTDLSRQRMLGLYGIEGGDLKTDTSGHQDEYFDHQANSTDISWQVNEQLSVKYIFGYTDYFYDRTTDVDLTSNPTFDNQYYVSQETEYVSHELQFFWDPVNRCPSPRVCSRTTRRSRSAPTSTTRPVPTAVTRTTSRTPWWAPVTSARSRRRRISSRRAKRARSSSVTARRCRSTA